ncbi:MAG: hypothetical protein QOE49_2814 [Rhodospirillaceae bacterium]|jgi:hypothetical protein|nr:hypothetical protein [Rhodospirillaceae bacterium]MEA2807657.1 hypothetical protein [Rhodospirillaceae bacterium]
MAKPARPISGFPEFAAALKQGREIADATAAEGCSSAPSVLATRSRRSCSQAASP